MYTSDGQSGFVRQRRNLFIVSIGLLIYETSNMNLERINIFGIEISVNNPTLLPIFIWTAYVYLLLRYFQHFNYIGDRGIRSMFNITINKYLIEWAYRIGKKEYIESDKINNTSKFDFGQCQSYFHEIKPWSITIEGKAPVIIRTNINDGIGVNPSE